MEAAVLLFVHDKQLVRGYHHQQRAAAAYSSTLHILCSLFIHHLLHWINNKHLSL